MRVPGPEHPIVIRPHKGRIVVAFADEIVADSQNALALDEASYKTVFYIPRTDAMLAFFEPSERLTHCPYKGEARYFHLAARDRRSENAVWSYETPYPAMRAIEGCLAFDPDKVRISLD